MKKGIHLLSRIIDQFSKAFMVAFLGAAFIAIIYQVFTRYVLLSPFIMGLLSGFELNKLNFPWLEEFVRYLFIWVVFLGIGVVYKLKGHAQVEILTNYFAAKWRNRTAVAVEVLNSFFFVLLAVKCYAMMKITNGQLSPSLQINMAWMYLSIILCSAICFIHSVTFLIEGAGSNAAPEAENAGSNNSDAVIEV